MTCTDAPMPEERLDAYAALYERTLLEDVVPFWLRHGRDLSGGGIANQLADNGQAVGTDKFLWSQGRGLWTFSALYNRIAPRPEWLAFAEHIYTYIAEHGRDQAGHWQYRLDQNGTVLDGDVSIYVDGFIMAGLTEFFLATGRDDVRQLAMDTFVATRDRLGRPGSYEVAPYTIPAGLKTHGISMLFSWVFFALGRALGEPDVEQEGIRLSRSVLGDFYVPSRNAILEFVTLDGEFVDTPAGRACVPGHALESLWFAISIMEQTEQTDQIPTCCALIRRHLELGWDEEFGGLRLALDIDGKSPPFWGNPDYKPWWVQVESLVATAYAYGHTGDTAFLDWHDRIREYAYAHFPVNTGEWAQWLDRRGNRAASAALPVKDPFHLPRGLIVLMQRFTRGQQPR